jgi:hypothetical protein
MAAESLFLLSGIALIYKSAATRHDIESISGEVYGCVFSYTFRPYWRILSSVTKRHSGPAQPSAHSTELPPVAVTVNMTWDTEAAIGELVGAYSRQPTNRAGRFLYHPHTPKPRGHRVLTSVLSRSGLPCNLPVVALFLT